MQPPPSEPPLSMLGRGLRLLTAFRHGDDAVSLSELCRRTGLPKATGHRLVHELLDAGFLEHAGTGLRLGIRVFELGQLAPGQGLLRERAEPFLRRLVEATGQTVHLAVRTDAEVCYLDKRTGRFGPRVPTRIGGRMPMHSTALGKALLAYTPPHQLRALLGGGLARLTPRTVTAPGMLGRELAATRRRGVAVEIEESVPGIACVAAPVLEDGQRAHAALSLAGSVHRMRPEKVASLVRSAADDLARALAAGR